MVKPIRASTNKRGRPKTTGPGKQVVVRFQPPQLEQIDAWIDGQPPPKPTRAEAVRRIVAKAFSGW